MARGQESSRSIGDQEDPHPAHEFGIQVARVSGEPELVAERSVPAPFSPKGGDRSPSYDQIAIVAYQRWLARGKPHSTDWEDWFAAERQLAATA